MSRTPQQRLEQGCCPVHGIGMGQIGCWYYPPDAEAFTVVQCPRRDCRRLGKTSVPGGLVTLISPEIVDSLPVAWIK